MADRNIGALPQAPQLNDDSLLVVEQQGQAMKLTGAQFKEFGKTAVINQVQGYVDQAQSAADRAVDAVSGVTDMTVEASTLPSGQSATVTKSTRDGKVNLSFGLPRGAQGIPGPPGEQGPQGAKGDPGGGLKILGYYDTLSALEVAVPTPEPGDAYSIGLESPYDIYIFDGVTGEWKNNGPLSGGGGGPLPEHVVTAQGGASMTFPLNLGDGPHTITFEYEEEAPLTAEDVQYSTTQNVKQAIDDLKFSVSNGKQQLASAITDKGVTTAQDASFEEMAENIRSIHTGLDTSDATATPFDILSPRTAYTSTGKTEGVIPTLAAQIITPGTADKTISNGQYLGGIQTIKGDANLTSGNIKKGVTLFGVTGALETSFKATLTVKADIGAVVTATHTNGTEVEALSTTGTVVLELPIEGTWKVTAVRGVAQYNTVTLEVTSQYSAELTAEVHIEYYGYATDLRVERADLVAASNRGFAIFAGGKTKSGSATTVDGYNEMLTRSAPSKNLSQGKFGHAAAAIESMVIFAGGQYQDPATQAIRYSSSIDVYRADLVWAGFDVSLSEARANLAGASIGTYCLFGGGTTQIGTTGGPSIVVDAIVDSLTRLTPVGLSSPASGLAAASNDNYAVFGGGSGPNSSTAYDSELVRTIPAGLSSARTSLAAARAGNYILFAGGSGGEKAVDAYDLFLTRTLPEQLMVGRGYLAGTTLNGYAIFAGGATGFGPLSDADNSVDVYDPYLVRTAPKQIGNDAGQLAAASIGNFALFGGGYNWKYDRYYNYVYAYQKV